MTRLVCIVVHRSSHLLLEHSCDSDNPTSAGSTFHSIEVLGKKENLGVFLELKGIWNKHGRLGARFTQIRTIFSQVTTYNSSSGQLVTFHLDQRRSTEESTINQQLLPTDAMNGRPGFKNLMFYCDTLLQTKFFEQNKNV